MIPRLWWFIEGKVLMGAPKKNLLDNKASTVAMTLQKFKEQLVSKKKVFTNIHGVASIFGVHTILIQVYR